MENKLMRESKTNTQYLSDLKEFIAIKSVAGCSDENRRAVNYLVSKLELIGFTVSVEGKNELEQPVIMARAPSINSNKRVLLYGHYDVAPVESKDEWVSKDPFLIEEIDGRIFGRGVADNKSTLLARIHAYESAKDNGESLPEVLWLIQGKEETLDYCKVTEDIFRLHVNDFNASMYIDETGFNDVDTGESILFFWSKDDAVVTGKNVAMVSNMLPFGRVENRHLNKFNGGEQCPLLNTIPLSGLYVGFGPNDKHHRIHKNNESISLDFLLDHISNFSKFLVKYAKS